MVANTPSFLFRHFQRETSVQDFSDQHSVDELVKIIREISDVPADSRRLEDIVAAYAAIVGLTFKNFEAVENARAKLEFNQIIWADHILQIWDPNPTLEKIMIVETTSQGSEPDKKKLIFDDAVYESCSIEGSL